MQCFSHNLYTLFNHSQREFITVFNIPLVSGDESWAPVIYNDDLYELFIKAAESD
jgi:hypothetical protein